MWVYPWPYTGGSTSIQGITSCLREKSFTAPVARPAGSLQVSELSKRKAPLLLHHRVDRNTGAEGGPMKLTPSTGFCYGYNDWGGINEFTKPYQGLGADITPNGREPWQKR